MRFRKLLGTILKYGFFAVLLSMQVVSLYQDAISITNKMEWIIHILTDSLIISACVGEIGSLMVIDQFNILLTGKTPNFVDDVREESSSDFSVTYNGLFVMSFFHFAFMALYIIYAYTQNHIYKVILKVSLLAFVVFTVINVLSKFLKMKRLQPTTYFSKFSNPVFIPMIIFTIQLLVTRNSLVSFVFRNIYKPQNDTILILTLILVLCYFLAIAFCHFSNIYCLIGFVFIKKDIEKIENKVKRLEEKDDKREEDFRKTIEHIDETAEQSGIIKRIGLSFSLWFAHVKFYVLDRVCAVLYLLSFVNFKITKCLKVLLEPEQIRINCIRFCCVFAVLELLVLDMVLFIFLDGDAPGLKFFELLSTVIIIPILLSWLSELKSKKSE